MIHPMLCTLVKEPFYDNDWLFEIKWDGIRALAQKNQKVSLLSRNQESFNDRVPVIVQELQQLPAPFVLGGEIVVLDSKGRSQFQLLQNASNQAKAIFYVFDILSYRGKDLSRLPLTDRKQILHNTIRKK